LAYYERSSREVQFLPKSESVNFETRFIHSLPNPSHMSEVSEEVIEAASEAVSCSVSPRDFPGLGAAVGAEDGNIYTGSVVETRDRHQSIHAERLAVFNAVSAHEEENLITELAINFPLGMDEENSALNVCGSCLHIFAEFSEGDVPIHMKGAIGSKQAMLSELYPDPWG